MGRERRKWSQQEDSLLRDAVQKLTSESRPLLWREVAKSVPDRTNKDCRRRWCNILAGGTSKGHWTESEDERLSRAIREHGPQWTRVAAAVETRNPDQCSSHWSLSLNPNIDYSDWTKNEVGASLAANCIMDLMPLIPVQDQRLLQAVEHYGRNWSMIASTSLQNRTTLALKNRYSALQSKTQQPSETHVDDAQSGYMDFRSDHTSCNQSGSNGLSILGHNVRNAGGYSDEDDDEDEDEDEEDQPDDKGKQSYDITDFGLPLDYSSLSHADHKTPHTSCPSPKGRASGQRSPVSSKRPRLSTTALPTDTATPYTEQTDVPSPSTQTTATSSPRSPIHALHRVSVDAECTTEQLGDLMRTLVGVTKKVVIKIDEF
ncbi:MAG: hypothetical protein Q9203_002570 [Teloschistes exilis]